MADKRKVLFTYGMSNDYQLIITDAPKEAIEEWCMCYMTDMENGVHNDPFYQLKTRYYVREIVDSEYDEAMECVELLGYDESYDYSYYHPEKAEKTHGPKYVGRLSDASIEEFLKILERYKGKGKKLSVMGTSFFNVFDDGKYIILDEEDLSEDYSHMELNLADGKLIKVPLTIDLTMEGILDKQKEELWKLLLSYMQIFGIQVHNPDEPDLATVKEVQENILKVFKKAGVRFNV